MKGRKWRAMHARRMFPKQRDTSHLSQSEPTTADIQQYWKSKEGFCQACGADIAIEDQYCPECESFLSEMYDKGDQ